jgi:hypothetical protein
MRIAQFRRDQWLIWFYDEARQREEKHSAAVEEAVQEYREKFPDARVSSTTVKRALARHRPNWRLTALTPVPGNPDEQFLARLREVLKVVAIMKHELLGHPLPAPDAPDPQITNVLDVCAGTRPIYPRHNKKDPKAKRRR